MILAIVGTRTFVAPDGEARAREIIRAELAERKPELVISGGASGVDSWAAEEALLLELAVEEITPLHARWEPNGYKARNMLIAERCDELISIRCGQATSYGSGWTADRAAELGRPVTRYTLDPVTAV
ncbi:MAG TPA: DNA-processing protein DprA [Acidimicrobiales bacterium]|nr:DNA-processing protein DprA [Acidimicrobiales bacterium]